MQKTLLDVVDLYLTYVDGFEVDSIFDSTEATQAAKICLHVLDTVYDKNKEQTFTQIIVPLESAGDNTLPNVLLIPDTLQSIAASKIFYNTAETGTMMQAIQYIEPADFMRLQMNLSSTVQNTEVVRVNGIEFVIYNNRSPLHCTSFDDRTLVFDSYNKAIDTTLQESKSQVIGYKTTASQLSDTYVIPLPPRMLSGYIDACILECSTALRSAPIGTVARRSNQFLSKIQQSQSRVSTQKRPTNRFGRR